MNKLSIYLLLPLLLTFIMVIPISEASGCGLLPSGFTSSYCIPTNIVGAINSGTQLSFVFNALNYSTYITGTANNIFIYNTISGNSCPAAWIEGNVLNEQQTTNLNTVSQLYIWCNFPDTIGSGSSDTNWAIGIASSGTNIFSQSSAKIGEAPQLSPNYGEWDNGNSVFNFYDGFYGSTLNTSKWTTVAGQTGGTATVNNGLTLANNAGQYIAYQTITNYPPPTNIIDIYEDVTTLTSSNCGYQDGSGWGGTGEVGIGTYQNSAFGLQSYVSGNGCTGSLPFFLYYVYTLNASSTPNYWATYDYNAMAAIELGSQIPALAGLTETVMAAQANGGHNAAFEAYWYRVRTAPPNGQMPTTSFGTLQQSYSAPTVTISPASNSIVFEYEYESFNGIISGGTPPYNIFLYISNAISNGKIVYSTNAIFSGTTWSFNGIQTLSNWVSNSPLVANVVLTDSNPTTVNSIYTTNFIVNPVNPPIITLSHNPLSFGYTDIITVQATNPITDTIYLYANSIIGGNILLASTSNSYSYIFYGFSPPAIGNYVLTANDPMTGESNSIILIVANDLGGGGGGGSGGSGSNDLLPEALMGILGGAALFLWYLALRVKNNTLFRILLISTGFALLMAAMAILAAFTNAYTVPAGVSSEYYAQAAINAMGNLDYNIMYAFILIWVTYIAIEIVLYWKNITLLAKQKKAGRLDAEYAY